MFRDGWVCRACWKPNRANDDRCYSCKTPRDEQVAVEAGSKVEAIKPGAHLEGRLDAEVPVLAWLITWPLRYTGGGLIVVGFIATILTVTSDEVGTVAWFFDVEGQVVALLVSFGFIAAGFLQFFIARSIRRHERWAYVIAVGIGFAASVGRIFLGATPDPGRDHPVQIALYYGSAWLYFGMALIGAALFVASFVRVKPKSPDVA